MRGVSGCGKSTYVAREFPEAFVVSADHFFELDEGEYAFDPNKLDEAHQDCFRRFHEAIDREEPLIVVDNTNITRAEVSPYRLAAAAAGYDVQIITLLCDPKVAAARTIHNVPFSKIEYQDKLLHAETFPKQWKHTVIENYSTDK